MELNGISSSDAITGAPSTAPSSSLDKDAFLKLLVSQVKNQDPMQPIRNAMTRIANVIFFATLLLLANFEAFDSTLGEVLLHHPLLEF